MLMIFQNLAWYPNGRMAIEAFRHVGYSQPLTAVSKHYTYPLTDLR